MFEIRAPSALADPASDDHWPATLAGHHLRFKPKPGVPIGMSEDNAARRTSVPAGSSFCLSSRLGLTALAGRDGRAGVTARRHTSGRRRGSTTHRSLVTCVCRPNLAGHLAITPLPRSRTSVLPLLGRGRVRGEAGPGLRLLPNPLIPGRIALAPVLSRGGSRSPALPVAAAANGAAGDSGDGHQRLREGFNEERDRHTQ